MSELGEIITINGRPERIVEREMIFRDEKPFYVALRTVPVDELGKEIQPDAGR